MKTSERNRISPRPAIRLARGALHRTAIACASLYCIASAGCNRQPPVATGTAARDVLETADWKDIDRCAVYLDAGESYEIAKPELESAIKMYMDVTTALAKSGVLVPNADVDEVAALSTFALSFRTTSDVGKRTMYYYGSLRRVQLIERGHKQTYDYDDATQEFLSACYKQLKSKPPNERLDLSVTE